MKKTFFIILLVLSIFSCGNGNKTEKTEKKENQSASNNQSVNQEKEMTEEEKQKFLKERKETETYFENELMKYEVNGNNDTKQLSEDEIIEIKTLLRKKFKHLGVTAVTKDGRFFVNRLVADASNKDEVAKEIIIERVDITDAIIEWCLSKGIEYKFIIIEFYDLEKGEKISEDVYSGRILQVLFQREDYKEAISKAFAKYKRATKY